MTAKEAFRLAASIFRYNDVEKWDDDIPALFNHERDVTEEIGTIPDCIFGAASKWYIKSESIDSYTILYIAYKTGRIMEMYKEKIHDMEWLAKGSRVGRPNGYGYVAGRMVVQRLELPQVRMT